MRRVQHIMGLPISIDIPQADGEGPFQSAFKRFEQIDGRYSPYKPDSEVSRFAAGRLLEKDLSSELKAVIKACRAWEKQTNGYFSAWAAASFDPSGYVKGWAIAEAGRQIEKAGCKTYCIAAGGDILCRSEGSKQWGIGIQNPTDKTKILNKLSISNGAVATSGSYERGAHIIDPKTGRAAAELLSVTIIGPDIVKADVLATAVFVMGQKGADFISQWPDYEALIIKKG